MKAIQNQIWVFIQEYYSVVILSMSILSILLFLTWYFGVFIKFKKMIIAGIFSIFVSIWVISPLDGDFIPIFGWIDDILLILFLYLYIIEAKNTPWISSPKSRKGKELTR